MIKRVFLSIVVLFLMSSMGLFAQADLERTENQMKSAIHKESEVQKEVENWTEDKVDLVAEIRTIQTTNTWLEYQNQKEILETRDLMSILKRVE